MLRWCVCKVDLHDHELYAVVGGLRRRGKSIVLNERDVGVLVGIGGNSRGC